MSSLSLSASAAAVTLTLALASQVAAQQAPPPAETRKTIPMVFGSVELPDGRPVRGALVRATRVGGGTGGVAMTAADGTYKLHELAPGSYAVVAMKSGFVTMSFGQRHPSDPSRPVEVSSENASYRADFVLLTGGVLTGTVLDEYGDPAPGRYISPLRLGFVGGKRLLTPAGNPVSTNDIGEFRIAGLAPGPVYLQVTGRTGLGDVFESTVGYAPTYFPGVEDPQSAQTIEVELGRTHAGLTISLVSVRLAKVSGTVVTSEGRPVERGFFNVFTRRGAPLTIAAGNVGPGGAFAAAGIPPGEYLFRADSNSAGPDGMPLTATAIVQVGGVDLTDVTLTSPDWATVKGRIVMPADRTSLSAAVPRIVVSPWEAGTPLWDLDLGRAAQSDGSFAVRALPVQGRITVLNLPMGLSVGEILQGERNVTDEPLDLRGGQIIEDVTIRLTATAPSVTGRVTDGRDRSGQPVVVRGYVVVIFPEDRTRWEWMSRYISVIKPGNDGTFRSPPMPPGRFWAVAVSGLRSGEEFDKGFLESAVPLSEALDLVDGKASALDLRLARLSAGK